MQNPSKLFGQRVSVAMKMTIRRIKLRSSAMYQTKKKLIIIQCSSIQLIESIEIESDIRSNTRTSLEEQIKNCVCMSE